MKYRALLFAALALMIPVAVACGGDDDTNSGSRPSVAEIQDGLEKAASEGSTGVTLPEKASKCIAEGLHKSDLPNGVLRKVADGEEAEVDKDNEDKYRDMATKVGEDCVKEMTGGMTVPTTAAP